MGRSVKAEKTGEKEPARVEEVSHARHKSLHYQDRAAKTDREDFRKLGEDQSAYKASEENRWTDPHEIAIQQKRRRSGYCAPRILFWSDLRVFFGRLPFSTHWEATEEVILIRDMGSQSAL